VIRDAAGSGRSVSIEREGGDVVLSTARLGQILEHEAGDLTCTVEAGIRLSALDAALAPHGQMLALDPPGDPTIGACLAANLSGPRRHRYGTMRDLVIGATVVLGDGTIASSGGKVVKNVAGYDLAKLFCGSEGRLGLIARVSLRLHPRPAASATVVAPATAGNAEAVLRSTLVPSAVDVHWPDRLALLFEGSERAVEAQVAAARDLCGAEEAGEGVWAEAGERQLQLRGRLAFVPGSLADLLAGLDEAIVRVSAGVAYVPEPVADSRDPAEIALVERIRAQFDPQGVLV
jgi:glycolate oxidase FAD binding subunit